MKVLRFAFVMSLFSLFGVSAALGASGDKVSPSEYKAAVRQLEGPGTWCKGAATLKRARRSSAVAPLLRAYESRPEGDKLCLLEAPDALNSVALVREWGASKDSRQRRMAAHLMELSFRKAHLPTLVALCADHDQRVRRQALSAIATQRQTVEWESAMIALLSSTHIDARERAVRSLDRRRTETARKALRERFAVETDAYVKREIEKTLVGAGGPRR